jgi:hypothetical protein
MADERAFKAIARIERALARIEAAARPDAASSVADAGADDQELARLREAHRALRQRVEGAIGEIDRLIAGGGRG